VEHAASLLHELAHGGVTLALLVSVVVGGGGVTVAVRKLLAMSLGEKFDTGDDITL
jgi:hypothetical protein